MYSNTHTFKCTYTYSKIYTPQVSSLANGTLHPQATGLGCGPLMANGVPILYPVES